MNFIIEKYPQLHEVYIHLINTNEYAQHPLVKWSNKNMSKVIDDVANNIKNRLVIDDIIVSSAVDSECTGFILGFSYALNLIKEVDILKEIAE